jgi:Tol biopolymer transport system component
LTPGATRTYVAAVTNSEPPTTASWRFGRSLSVFIVALTVLIGVQAAPAALAAFPGANGSIVFVRDGHIWVVHTDGTQEKIARGDEPTWSPDGTRIAYVRRSFVYNNDDVWMMLADGTDKVRVTRSAYSEVSPGWSPDGSRIVFSRLEVPGLYKLFTIPSTPPFGGGKRLGEIAGTVQHARWSPDGTKIAFDVRPCLSCGYQIGVIGADGNGLEMLTPLTDATDIEPEWSPDGTTLLFQSNRDGDPHYADYDVYSMSSAGGAVTRVLPVVQAEINLSPAWAPDGTRFVFTHHSGTGRVTVRTAAADGSDIQVICHGGNFFYTMPEWQPTF